MHIADLFFENSLFHLEPSEVCFVRDYYYSVFMAVFVCLLKKEIITIAFVWLFFMFFCEFI